MHLQLFRPRHGFMRWLVALPLLLAIVPTSAQSLPITPSPQARAASDSENGHLSLVQRLGGGTISEIEIDGARAFVSDGRGVSLLDISQPDQPVLIARQSLYNTAQHMDVEGDLVYVAEQRGRLEIVDFSNPAQPILRSTYIAPVPDQYTIPEIYSVKVVGNRAYLAANLNGMLILDVSNPDNPHLLGQYATAKFAKDVQVVGSLAYIGERGRQILSVVDVSNPSQPTLVYELVLPFTVERIKIVGELAYLSLGSAIQIVDLSDPVRPVARGSLDPHYYTSELTVVGSLAYITDTRGSFTIINVANPDQPVLVKTYQNWRQAWDVAITHNRAMIVADERLVILDISEPQNVQQVGTYESKGYSVIDADDNRLYVITDAGFEILDIQNPAQPVLLGAYAGWIFSAVIVNRIGYLNLPDGLHIVDLRDPTQPRKLGGYADAGRIAQVSDGIGYGFEVYSSGEYRYESELQIFDLRDPAHPRLLGQMTFDDEIFDLWVVGQQVYLAASRLGLLIVDVRDPAHPVQQGRGPTRHSLDVQVASGRAYVADFFEGLKIVDVRDPAQTQIIGRYEGKSNRQLEASEITLYGPWAYVSTINATAAAGLWVVNTIDPANPILWDYYDMPWIESDIVIDGNTVYLSGEGEIYMLRINDHVMQPQAHLPITSMSQN